MPWIGSWCPAPATLYASTWVVPELLLYRVRFQLATGVSLDDGVWLTPRTFGPLLDLFTEVVVVQGGVGGAVPQLHARARAGVAGVGVLRTRSPHCCGVMETWPPAQGPFQPRTVPV